VIGWHAIAMRHVSGDASSFITPRYEQYAALSRHAREAPPSMMPHDANILLIRARCADRYDGLRTTARSRREEDSASAQKRYACYVQYASERRYASANAHGARRCYCYCLLRHVCCALPCADAWLSARVPRWVCGAVVNDDFDSDAERAEWWRSPHHTPAVMMIRDDELRQVRQRRY